MSTDRVLALLRSTPWAILDDYFEAIEAIVMRAHENPAILKIEGDGHIGQFEAMIASMGERVPGTNRATVRDGVGIVPIMGPIFPRANLMTSLSGATALTTALQDLTALENNPNIRSVLLAVNSPGGVTDGVHQFTRRVAAYSKPISAHIEGTGASAAYWIASAAPGGISIEPTSRVGSLGVAMGGSVQESPDSRGRRDVAFVSSNAPNKRPDLTSDEGKAQIVAMLDAIEDVFHSDVAQGRKVSLDKVRADFGRGGTLPVQQAKDVGMVDTIEPDGLDGAIRRLSARAPATSRRTASAQHQMARLRASL